MPAARPLIYRFLEKTRRAESGCLEWTGATARGGYGNLMVVSRTWGPAHRVAWELAHGPIPDGLWVLHRCDNPKCVEADHLFLGTHADNMSDMVAKGRHPSVRSPECRERGGRHWTKRHPDRVARGERGSGSKLTEAGVVEIRRLRASGAALSELAAAFNVSETTISSIAHKKTWKHVG